MEERITQKQLILNWIDEHEYIIPAKMCGLIYNGIMFGSDSPKRCREMRQSGILESAPDENPKFERFFRKQKTDIWSKKHFINLEKARQAILI